ncbi:MAG: 2-dehydropantoate 2-reductase N-terminal domain-containing protein [Deltaproteobacteria bacterium]|nr:2-dehydropantoate 2-reductase N-terminal domain-containing protein [Deltaproteobacteria bacterium]
MHIAVLGTGAIGSALAFCLAQAGHTVTAIARGARLAELTRDNAIVLASGARAEVTVAPALDPETAFDLVIVTVIAADAGAVLPALSASRATHVMFMFNTFDGLERLREAVGEARCAFGFPAIIARLDDGKLTLSVHSVGQVTTVDAPRWAALFCDAGIPTQHHPDMPSWLRTHVAFMVPIMLAGLHVSAQKAGLTWPHAVTLADAMDEGFCTVRALGHRITPSAMTAVAALPTKLKAALLWSLSRTPVLRNAGIAGPREARSLIDAIEKLAPGQTPSLQRARP